MSTKGRNNMGNSSDSDGDQTGQIKQLPLIKGGGSNMNMMNMQHMNNSFHHNSSQISETTYSMKAENPLVPGKKKNSSTFNTSKYMAHSPSPSQTFFKGKFFRLPALLRRLRSQTQARKPRKDCHRLSTSTRRAKST